ncbi:MAG: hypothetical protein NZM42_11995 [Gemmatales bacterium]|nr:hypothetical protein [Gemmatales bacterium]
MCTAWTKMQALVSLTLSVISSFKTLEGQEKASMGLFALFRHEPAKSRRFLSTVRIMILNGNRWLFKMIFPQIFILLLDKNSLRPKA